MTLSVPNMKSCADCPIRYNPVCSKCEPDEIERLEQIKYYRSF
ncbi:MAG: transcriptional regulator, partial [Proteobacteria bacterium]|nr:transcriptional regulator [Pseudomonadota bacterium]